MPASGYRRSSQIAIKMAVTKASATTIPTNAYQLIAELSALDIKNRLIREKARQMATRPGHFGAASNLKLITNDNQF
jgi:hypothetical protein